MTAHWGIQDPAAAEGSEEERRRAFNRTFRELDARIKLLTSLRIEALDEVVASATAGCDREDGHSY